VDTLATATYPVTVTSTPIARIAQWIGVRRAAARTGDGRPGRATSCAYCRTPLGVNDGIWDKEWRELTCGSDSCETERVAAHSW
jgi:hypothetical protein